MRSQAPANDLDPIVSGMLQAERRIALLDACVPLNAREERRRVVEGWQQGRESRPYWILPRVSDLTPTRRALEIAGTQLQGHPLEALYVARIEELSLEAELVDVRGTPAFLDKSARRYPLTTREAELADDLSLEWLGTDLKGFPSVEKKPAADLVAALRRRIDELGDAGSSVRVEMRADMASFAAVGEDVVFVCEGVELAADQIERIVLHEIEGHLLPRARARQEGGIFRVGSAGAGEDEEGRALNLEERHGYLRADTSCGARRRRELALRHRAASAVRQGADFTEVMRLCLGYEDDILLAYRTCERALRGGGLAREVCYLPALTRVRTALEDAPELETWMKRGRISVAAAHWLKDELIG